MANGTNGTNGMTYVLTYGHLTNEQLTVTKASILEAIIQTSRRGESVDDLAAELDKVVAEITARQS